MHNLTESIIYGRLDRNVDELPLIQRASGQVIESLSLSIGCTYIERELLPDGTRGDVHIKTNEALDILGRIVVNDAFLLQGGKIVTDPEHHSGETRPVTGFKKARTLAKIAFSRVSHLKHIDDFSGPLEEEK